MARVKNQVLFQDEESYTDEGGQVHYNGVAYRSGATEAYPGYIGSDFDTVRKSPRSWRPPSRGKGSRAQGPWRDCFALCARRWSEMSDVCSDDPVCDPPASKKNVYDAKTSQGVSCSAFDLYMRCCLQHCVTIEISAPDGVTYAGGALPDAEECFPCGQNLPEYSIAASSAVVPCNGSIALSIDPPPPPGVTASIALSSGGGALVDGVYTAPPANPGCKLNPVFSLTVCGQPAGEYSLSVSCYNPAAAAYWENPGCANYQFLLAYGCACTIGWGDPACHYREMSCDGVFLRETGHYEIGPAVDQSFCFDPPGQPCDAGQFPDIIDIRTSAMIEAGCCPPIS